MFVIEGVVVWAIFDLVGLHCVSVYFLFVVFFVRGVSFLLAQQVGDEGGGYVSRTLAAV